MRILSCYTIYQWVNGKCSKCTEAKCCSSGTSSYFDRIGWSHYLGNTKNRIGWYFAMRLKFKRIFCFFLNKKCLHSLEMTKKKNLNFQIRFSSIIKLFIIVLVFSVNFRRKQKKNTHTICLKSPLTVVTNDEKMILGKPMNCKHHKYSYIVQLYHWWWWIHWNWKLGMRKASAKT